MNDALMLWILGSEEYLHPDPGVVRLAACSLATAT